jgi:hypothetical protein
MVAFSWKYRRKKFIEMLYLFVRIWWGDLAGNIKGRNLSKKVFLFARIWGCKTMGGG